MGCRSTAARCGTAVCLATALAAAPASAQSYPSRPIKIVVPSSPGGITDFIGRLAADFIGRKTDQVVVVENHTGAGGTVGMEVVAKSAPDGYTLGSANTGDVISGLLHKHLSFNAQNDLVPVGIIGEAPQYLVVNTNFPAATFKEFITYGRAHPGQINYGSAGVGSINHIGAAYLAHLAGLDLVHVPYRGAVPAVTDMISGRIQMMHTSLNPIIAHIRAGSLRPLVVTALERWKDYLPDVPTSAEVGMPDYEMGIWFGLAAPRGTPRPILDQLNGYLREMAADPATRKRIIEGFLRPVSMTSDEVSDYVARDLPHWERLIRESGVPTD